MKDTRLKGPASVGWGSETGNANSSWKYCHHNSQKFALGDELDLELEEF